MPFIDHKQVEKALRKRPLHELSGLVAPLPERELLIGETALYAIRLPVPEDQLPVFIHEVQEIVRVVREHAARGIGPELDQQPVGCFQADSGQLAHRASYDGRSVLGNTGPFQGPQRRAAFRTTAVFVIGDLKELGRRHPPAFLVQEQCSAIRARGVFLCSYYRPGVEVVGFGVDPFMALS